MNPLDETPAKYINNLNKAPMIRGLENTPDAKDHVTKTSRHSKSIYKITPTNVYLT